MSAKALNQAPPGYHHRAAALFAFVDGSMPSPEFPNFVSTPRLKSVTGL
jgi:hypothetical protein